MTDAQTDTQAKPIELPRLKTYPPYRGGSVYQIRPGEKFWQVNYRDNSDAGRENLFFVDEEGARAFADDLIANPPKGNYFHPAPDTLDIRVYAVERLR